MSERFWNPEGVGSPVLPLQPEEADQPGESRVTSDLLELQQAQKTVGAKPPGPSPNQGRRKKENDDNARYVKALDTFHRPTLAIPGSIEFEWPLGIEGFVVSGSPLAAEHHYIGDNAVVMEVIHRDDRRIAMNGVFPGRTAHLNMNYLLDVLTRPYGPNGKLLTLPGVFPHQQFVVHEDYRFEHADDLISDDTIAYSITFRRTGIGDKAKLPPLSVQTPTATEPRGTTHRYKTVGTSTRTLRAIAALRDVFADPSEWKRLYSLNKVQLSKMGISLTRAATAVLPLGTKIYYN